MSSRENQEKAEGNGGNKLIEALQNYIIPLIEGSSHQGEGSNTSTSGLTLEAIDLLAALQNFVASLTAAKKSPQKINVVDPEQFVTSSTSISPVIAERPPLLKVLLGKARDRVFNKMPIRMLAFSKDGSDIKLVDRPEILRIVWEKIEEDFYSSNFYDKHEYLLYKNCGYAILSHTWLRESPGEVTFTQWTTNSFDKHLEGYRKLEMFCRVAALNHGLTLGWMDTCCIDKSSSSELDESIRSMFRWYHSSGVCVTYLADTMALEEMHNDTWFTRGWTLQELIAPVEITFYAKNWETITSDKEDKHNPKILKQIHQATTITNQELKDPRSVGLSRRMQWVGKRNVTREEDTAYSLMGIFNVSFSTAYGEGADSAFRRLILEILSANHNHMGALDLVNCGHSPSIFSAEQVIPRSPKSYALTIPDIKWHIPYEPVVSTPLGLRVSVLVMPALGAESANTKKFAPRGSYYAIVHDSPIYSRRFIRSRMPMGYSAYNVLDNRLYDNQLGLFTFGGMKVVSNRAKSLILGVLNFEESATAVGFAHGQVCFAVVLKPKKEESESIEEATFSYVQTVKPVTFELQSIPTTNNDVKILKKDLHKHGMMLKTVYL